MGRLCYRPLRAFTLLEAMLVVVILACLAGVAAPRVSAPLHTQQAASAARRIAADIAYAKREARISSSERVVRFTASSASYQILDVAGLSGSTKPYVVQLAASPYKSRLAAVDLGGDAEIHFSGYGYPDSGGTIVVTSGGVSRTLTVDAVTGYVTIH